MSGTSCRVAGGTEDGVVLISAEVGKPSNCSDLHRVESISHSRESRTHAYQGTQASKLYPRGDCCQRMYGQWSGERKKHRVINRYDSSIDMGKIAECDTMCCVRSDVDERIVPVKGIYR